LPWFQTVHNSTNYSYNITYVENTTLTVNNSIQRKLLNWKDNLNVVQQYSSSIADGTYANLNPLLAENWNKGPFFWPPRYNYQEKAHICLAAEIAYDLTSEVLLSTFQYYDKSGPTRPQLEQTFKEALPQMPPWLKREKLNEPYLVEQFKNFLRTFLSIDVDVVQDYTSSPDFGKTPSQLSRDLTALLECDFVKVQHCTGHRRSLLWGGIIIALFFIFLSLLAKFLYIPMIDYFLFVAFVPMVMYYVYDYSLFCTPMLPTCFMEEILQMVKYFLPVSYKFPVALQYWDECVEGKTGNLNLSITPGTAECFRNCLEYPFHFETWEDNVAWLQCDLGFCTSSFVDTVYRPFLNNYPIPGEIMQFIDLKRYSHAIQQKGIYLTIGDQREAHSACCIFTIFNVVPVVLAAVAIIAILITTILAIFNIIKDIILFMTNLLVFVHGN
jgi:hypothetical protein